ncbi:MAG: hypothetical protein ACOYNJ_09570, partial [Candidatus Nanopelagicales bacterium]
MKFALGLVGAALLLTGCSQMYAATPVVTISATTAASAESIGLTVIPPQERQQTIVIAGATADGTELSTAEMGGDIVVVNAWAS